jgi:hypothetical protein
MRILEFEELVAVLSRMTRASKLITTAGGAVSSEQDRAEKKQSILISVTGVSTWNRT